MAWFSGGTLGSPQRDPTKTGGASGQGRTNINNQPVVGTAITRDEYAKRQAAALTPPPSALDAASLATGGAKSAAERQRKRAAAGSSTIASGSLGAAAPAASFTPKSLIGGY